MRLLHANRRSMSLSSLQYRHRCSSGVGLLEMMVVVVIVGVISAIAGPNFQAMIQNSRMTAAAESLRDAVMLGRTEAIRRGSQVTLRGTGNPAWTQGWELQDLNGGRIREGQFADGLAINLVNSPAGTNAIVFRPNGVINNTPTTDMHLLITAAGTTAQRAVRLNRGISVCKDGDKAKGDANCPI
jgi:prepilin-type N-terminal cleavage/methylation domain-containing protein